MGLGRGRANEDEAGVDDGNPVNGEVGSVVAHDVHGTACKAWDGIALEPPPYNTAKVEYCKQTPNNHYLRAGSSYDEVEL